MHVVARVDGVVRVDVEGDEPPTCSLVVPKDEVQNPSSSSSGSSVEVEPFECLLSESLSCSSRHLPSVVWWWNLFLLLDLLFVFVADDLDLLVSSSSALGLFARALWCAGLEERATEGMTFLIVIGDHTHFYVTTIALTLVCNDEGETQFSLSLLSRFGLLFHVHQFIPLIE